MRKPAQVTKLHPDTKLFVLDTNVLMHDPTSLFRFQEHDIFLPMATLEELDANKKGMSEVARNAPYTTPVRRLDVHDRFPQQGGQVVHQSSPSWSLSASRPRSAAEPREACALTEPRLIPRVSAISVSDSSR